MKYVDKMGKFFKNNFITLFIFDILIFRFYVCVKIYKHYIQNIKKL